MADQIINGICLIDPFLYDKGGHCFNYAYSFYKTAVNRKLRFMVLSNLGCCDEVKSLLPVMPVFRQRFMENSLWRRLPGANMISNYISLCRDFESANLDFLDDKWLVYFVNPEPLDMLAWAAIVKHKVKTLPTVIYMLRYGCNCNQKRILDKNAMRYKLAFSLLKRHKHFYNIHLVSDSELLAYDYQQLTEMPISVVPIPHTIGDFDNKSDCMRQKNKLTIVIPGRFTPDKGASTIVAIIDKLVCTGNIDNYMFKIQCYGNNEYDVHTLENIELLKHMDTQHVILLQDILDSNDYYRLLADADIVMLPYQASRYRGTSGPFTEALAMGKPVIVTDNTWMSNQLKLLDTGIVCPEGDTDAFIQALLEMKTHLPQFVQRANDNRARWACYHSPENFINEIINIANSTTTQSIRECDRCG
ncbi:MAG: glycosyltransferase [bacterium]|nr:glycosyltransferase [bacterium]